MNPQPQTREQLFEQELQARITPLLRDIRFNGSLLKNTPMISVNQILEHYSAASLRGVSKEDYTDIVNQDLNYHNVRFLYELIAGLTPHQLNVDPKTYLKILEECSENSRIEEKVLDADVLSKIKVEINNQFALIEKKIMESQNKKVNPSNR